MTDKTIGRAAAGIATLAVIFVLAFAAYMLGLIPTGPFWENFFAGVMSGLLLILLAAASLPIYLKMIFRPNLKLIPNSDFKLMRYFDGHLKGKLHVGIKNNGLQSIKSFYWSLLIPRRLNAVIQDRQGRIIGARKAGEYDYIRGYVDNRPVFPKDTLELPVTISLDTVENFEQWSIKYKITTEYGHYPAEMEMHGEMMDASAVADCAEFSVFAEVNREIVPPVKQVQQQVVPAVEVAAVQEEVQEERRETVAMNL